MTEDLKNKIAEAQQALKLAADMSAHYYNAPLIICYSGGKDSDVLLDIAKRCLQPSQFEVMNAHTTVDAPETVYHIREVFKECEGQGIKTSIHYPPLTMWRLIEKKKMPPTRIARYCCKVLKETSTPNRLAAVGVREDESTARRGRDVFAVLGQRKREAEYRSTPHTYAMFKLDTLGREDAYECKFIKACKEKRDTIANPIYKFTNQNVWEYAELFNLKMNPLYKKGYKRIGCIGCPLGGPKNQKKEFADYPKYKENYIKAFDRMLESRRKAGLKIDTFTDGASVMSWWLGDDPKQITIDQITEKEGKTNGFNL